MSFFSNHPLEIAYCVCLSVLHQITWLAQKPVWTLYGLYLNHCLALISAQASAVQDSQRISLLLLVIHNKFPPDKSRAKGDRQLVGKSNCAGRMTGAAELWDWWVFVVLMQVYFSAAAHLCLNEFDAVMYKICMRNPQDSSPKFSSLFFPVSVPFFNVTSWLVSLLLYEVYEWKYVNDYTHP